MITDKQAQELSEQWHGGQWTALYLISCNYGAYDKLNQDDWTRALEEANNEPKLIELSIWIRERMPTTITLYTVDFNSPNFQAWLKAHHITAAHKRFNCYIYSGTKSELRLLFDQFWHHARRCSLLV